MVYHPGMLDIAIYQSAFCPGSEGRRKNAGMSIIRRAEPLPGKFPMHEEIYICEEIYAIRQVYIYTPIEVRLEESKADQILPVDNLL